MAQRAPAPHQKETDVTRLTVRKLQDAGGYREALWFQLAFPEKEELRRFASQGAWPMALSIDDGPAAVDTKLVGEPQQHMFRLSALRSNPRILQHLPPSGVENVDVDQLCS